MKTTIDLPKMVSFFFGIAVLIVSTTEVVEVDNACHGTSNALQCSQHQLLCQQGTIFIVKAARGFKLRSNKCYIQGPVCTNIGKCCHDHGHDCLEAYTREAYAELLLECSNKTSCTYRTPKARRVSCPNDYKDWSGYSEVQFMCIRVPTMASPMHATPSSAGETAFPPLPRHAAGPSATRGSALAAVPQTSPSSTASSTAATVSSATVTADDKQQCPDSNDLPGIVGGTVGAVLVLLLLWIVLTIVIKQRCKPAERSAQPGADNCVYSGLSPSTRSQLRSEDGYVTLGQQPSVITSQVSQQQGAEDPPYSDPAYLTPVHFRMDDAQGRSGISGSIGMNHSGANNSV